MEFSDSYLKENMMGPNAVMLLDELVSALELTPDMRILDLGCGTGLTSMALADKTGATVFAADLWISASDNYERFAAMGFGSRIIPIHADVTAGLPFAHAYFDAAVSIDAYHYFGHDAGFMDQKLAPYVKKGGVIALAFPGFKQDFSGRYPEEMLLSWTPEALDTMKSFGWWERLFQKSSLIGDVRIREMDCFEQSWEDWLECDNPYAVADRAAMRAGAGRYMNLISVVCRRTR